MLHKPFAILPFPLIKILFKPMGQKAEDDLIR